MVRYKTDINPSLELLSHATFSSAGGNSMVDGCCDEKLRLLFEFQNATKLYSTRVGAMAEATAGIIPTAEFTRLSELASQAHNKCLKTRVDFFKHVEEHGC